MEENVSNSTSRVYERLGEGVYTCFLNRIQRGETRTGRAKVSIAYKVCDGEKKGQYVWDNVLVDTPVGCEILQKKLQALAPDVVMVDIAPETPASYMDALFETVKKNAGTARYRVKVSFNDKGFQKTYADKLVG